MFLCCFAVVNVQKILLPWLDLLMIVPVPLHHSTINGNFTFLLLELILADQVADLTPPVVASNVQEWQFHISTVRAHMGRSSGRSTPHEWHLVVKNGNMWFLLLELILAYQVADLAPPEPERPRRGVLRERPFPREGNYLVCIVDNYELC